ncbi:hypothetical protein ACAG25_23255 [Mycobacterium sp. pV006]|uniref:hypothetical protein n=1 Tax=Mycobacterium sp. pV006 TaxID=3238983 RepID=UPI00351B6ABA
MTAPSSFVLSATVGALIGSCVMALIWHRQPTNAQLLVTTAAACTALGGAFGAPYPWLHPAMPALLGFVCAMSPLAWVITHPPSVKDASTAAQAAVNAATVTGFHLLIGSAFALAGFLAGSAVYLAGSV